MPSGPGGRLPLPHLSPAPWPPARSRPCAHLAAGLLLAPAPPLPPQSPAPDAPHPDAPVPLHPPSSWTPVPPQSPILLLCSHPSLPPPAQGLARSGPARGCCGVKRTKGGVSGLRGGCESRTTGVSRGQVSSFCGPDAPAAWGAGGSFRASDSRTELWEAQNLPEWNAPPVGVDTFLCGTLS